MQSQHDLAVKKQLHGLSEFFSKEGVLLSSTIFDRGRAEGESKQFYYTGALYARKQYEKGVLHGLQEYFYENGDKKTVLHYDKGLLDGEVLLFWPGQKQKRCSFFSRGIKEGLDIIYSEEGVVLDEGIFLAGRPIGIHRRRYPQGGMKEEKRFHEKFGVDHILWDSEGRMTYEGIIVEGRYFRETSWTWPEGEKQIREGVLDGQHVRWQ